MLQKRKARTSQVNSIQVQNREQKCGIYTAIDYSPKQHIYNYSIQSLARL